MKASVVREHGVAQALSLLRPWSAARSIRPRPPDNGMQQTLLPADADAGPWAVERIRDPHRTGSAC